MEVKKAIAILALLPLALSLPSRPAPSYHAPAPSYGHPAPTYKAPTPSYGHHAPAYKAPTPSHGHGYGYEEPKHNCSVLDITEKSQICTPVIDRICESVPLPIKIIKDVDFTYDIIKTVCTESIETVPFEVCKYTYKNKYEDTFGKSFEVTFEKKIDFQIITVCHPSRGEYVPTASYHDGYGQQSYHKNFKWWGQGCKEVQQEMKYKSPVVTQLDIPVRVSYPATKVSCFEKTIELPVIQCTEIEEERTIQVPTTVDSEVDCDVCYSKLVEPSCKKIGLNLPKQVCKEHQLGYKVESKPAPSYAPTQPSYVSSHNA